MRTIFFSDLFKKYLRIVPCRSIFICDSGTYTAGRGHRGPYFSQNVTKSQNVLFCTWICRKLENYDITFPFTSKLWYLEEEQGLKWGRMQYVCVLLNFWGHRTTFWYYFHPQIKNVAPGGDDIRKWNTINLYSFWHPIREVAQCSSNLYMIPVWNRCICFRDSNWFF